MRVETERPRQETETIKSRLASLPQADLGRKIGRSTRSSCGFCRLPRILSYRIVYGCVSDRHGEGSEGKDYRGMMVISSQHRDLTRAELVLISEGICLVMFDTAMVMMDMPENQASLSSPPSRVALREVRAPRCYFITRELGES